MTSRPPREGTDPRLDLFCVEEQEAFRVHVQPAWVPEYLEPLFDVHGEAYPVLLDLEDLGRHMAEAGESYAERHTRLGGVELTADGPAAEAMGVWLVTAMSSGMRPRSK